MITFGEDLLRLLKLNRLTQDELAEWIAELHEKDVDPLTGKALYPQKPGIKEQLRVARLRGTEAFQYPLLNDIISFFKEHGCESAAGYLQGIFRAQCHQTDLIDDISAPNEHYLPLLNMIRFPSPSSTDLIEQWKRVISEGDHDFYRSFLSLYYRYSKSYVHTPLRKQVSIALARAAITYGDYSDAYIIAKRYEDAFLDYFNEQATRMQSRGHMRTSIQNQADMVRALQIKATSLSFILFFSPVTASKPLFNHAAHVLNIFKENELLDDNTTDLLKIEELTRYLRMLTRALWSGSHDKPLAKELVEIANQLGSRVSASRACSMSQRYIAADTIARAFALAGGVSFDMCFQWRQSALSWDKELDKIVGMHSNLRDYRNLVTEFLIACCVARHKGYPIESIRAECERELTKVLRSFGPDRMKHSRFTLLELKEFIAREYGEGKLLMDDFVSKDETELLRREVNQDLNKRAREVSELFFKVDESDEEYQICIRHLKLEVRPSQQDVSFRGSIITPM
jgi:hypothetical protein